MRILDLDVAIAGKNPAVTRIAGRHHAIEHVDAGFDRENQVFRRADAHQVARLVRRQAVRRVRHDALHFFLGLADADAADGVAGQVERDQRGRDVVAVKNVRVYRFDTALDDGTGPARPPAGRGRSPMSTAAIVMMVVSAAIPLVYFRRKGWLK